MTRLPARSAYLLYAAGSGLFFACYSTLANVYRVEIAHLDALQLVLVGTVLEGAVFLFEVPTGVVADSVSRRLSVLIGVALIGVGFLLEGALPLFGTILLAQLLWGIGSTFESGAVDAWVADEVGEARTPDVFLRGAQAGQAAALVGIVLAALVGQLGLAWPLRLAGMGFLVLTVVLASTMQETRWRPSLGTGGGPGAAFRATLRAGLAAAGSRPALRWTVLVALLAGAASEVFDRLWQARVLSFPLPLAERLGTSGFFGLIAALTMAASLIVTEVARRRVDAGDTRATARALAGITAVVAVAVAGFGLAGNVELALACYFTAILMRRVHAPLFRALVNRHSHSAVRATVFSLLNQADALGQIAAGPALGLLALAAGMSWGFVACAVVLVPAVMIFARPLARSEPVAAAD